MPFSPLRPTKTQWSALLAALAMMAYLLLGLEANRSDYRSLPDESGSKVEILNGAQSGAKLSEVTAAPDSAWGAWTVAGFAPSKRPGNVVWARVTIRNPDAEPCYGVLADAEHFADQLDCFSRRANAEPYWSHEKSGEWTAPADKSIWGRENAFPVFIPAHGEKTLYLRYQDAFGVWLNFNWWPKQSAFYASQLRSTLVEGLYFGTLLALLFYNVMLWLRIQLPSLGSYLCYLSSFAAFVFFARSMPQVVGWALGSPWMESLLDLAFSLSGFFLLRFVDEFLELAGRLPKTSRRLCWLKYTMLAAAVISITAPITGVQAVLSYVTMAASFVHVVVFIVAFAARRAGSPQATYIVLAFTMLFFGFAPPVASEFKLLTITDASRALMAGSALEMLLFSVAMSDRIGLLQQEKLAAQKALLKEAEQREILQEAYADDLALEVRERTEDLQRANEDKDRILAVLGHDLRSPLTGLTRSAEHWASNGADGLGFSVFARQAAQTGRGLLLLIEDLVMWARLRAGSRFVSDHSLAALVLPVLALHRFPAGEAGIALEVRMPEDVVVKTDPVPIQALLRNLLSNALKAARGRVTVEAVWDEKRIRVSVQDDGIGLPEALIHAFQGNNPELLPLNQGGLGLRLCLEISRTLDLGLSVRSMKDTGSEFQFLLAVPSA